MSDFDNIDEGDETDEMGWILNELFKPSPPPPPPFWAESAIRGPKPHAVFVDEMDSREHNITETIEMEITPTGQAFFNRIMSEYRVKAKAERQAQGKRPQIHFHSVAGVAWDMDRDARRQRIQDAIRQSQEPQETSEAPEVPKDPGDTRMGPGEDPNDFIERAVANSQREIQSWGDDTLCACPLSREHEPHTTREHYKDSCGGVGMPEPCGGCYDCMSAQVVHGERQASEKEQLIRDTAYNAMAYYVARNSDIKVPGSRNEPLNPDEAVMAEADALKSLLHITEALLRHANGHSNNPTRHLPSKMFWEPPQIPYRELLTPESSPEGTTESYKGVENDSLCPTCHRPLGPDHYCIDPHTLVERFGTPKRHMVTLIGGAMGYWKCVECETTFEFFPDDAEMCPKCTVCGTSHPPGELHSLGYGGKDTHIALSDDPSRLLIPTAWNNRVSDILTRHIKGPRPALSARRKIAYDLYAMLPELRKPEYAHGVAQPDEPQRDVEDALGDEFQ